MVPGSAHEQSLRLNGNSSQQMISPVLIGAVSLASPIGQFAKSASCRSRVSPTFADETATG